MQNIGMLRHENEIWDRYEVLAMIWLDECMTHWIRCRVPGCMMCDWVRNLVETFIEEQV